jgi:hypothetical protein
MQSDMASASCCEVSQRASESEWSPECPPEKVSDERTRSFFSKTSLLFEELQVGFFEQICEKLFPNLNSDIFFRKKSGVWQKQGEYEKWNNVQSPEE